MKSDKVLIVCDRGAIDNRAYMGFSSFPALCEVIAL